jgi:hypothetical protein
MSDATTDRAGPAGVAWPERPAPKAQERES